MVKEIKDKELWMSIPCRCGCGKKIRKYSNFHSKECEELFLKFSPDISKVIAYIVLGEEEELQIGDRINDPNGAAINRFNRGVGHKKLDYFPVSRVYRPLIVRRKK